MSNEDKKVTVVNEVKTSNDGGSKGRNGGGKGRNGR